MYILVAGPLRASRQWSSCQKSQKCMRSASWLFAGCPPSLRACASVRSALGNSSVMRIAGAKRQACPLLKH